MKTVHDMPSECLTMGFDGYKAAGYNPPRETVWKDHIRDRLATVGCLMVSNMAGAISSGIPDVTLHTNCAVLYMELKGLESPVRQKQAMVARAYNSKSFYSRGELCCFVYRAPDILGLLRPDMSILEIANVDALCNPGDFLTTLHRVTQPVVRGTLTEPITELINEAGFTKVPLQTFRMTTDSDEDTAIEIETYSPGLALKQLTGLTALSAVATYGGSEFRCDIVEIQEC